MAKKKDASSEVEALAAREKELIEQRARLAQEQSDEYERGKATALAAKQQEAEKTAQDWATKMAEKKARQAKISADWAARLTAKKVQAGA